jgi:hypothetical protein
MPDAPPAHCGKKIYFWYNSIPSVQTTPWFRKLKYIINLLVFEIIMKGAGRGRGGRRGTIRKVANEDETESSLETEDGGAIPATPVVVGPEKASKIQKTVRVDSASSREQDPAVNQAQLSLVGPPRPVVGPEKASKIQKTVRVDAAVNQAQLSLVGPPRPVVQIPRIDAGLLSCFGGFSQVDLNALDYFFAWSTLYGSVEISKGLLILSQQMRQAINQHNHVCTDMAMVNEKLEFVFKEKTDAEQENVRLLVCCLIHSTLCLFSFVLMG